MTLSKNLQKKYGNVEISADFILEQEQEIISVSPAIDIGLSGGIPEGSWTILTGAAKCGKSSLALTIAANAQKSDRKIFYFDIEGRLKKMNLSGIRGLDTSKEKFSIIRSNEETVLAAEDFCTIAEEKVKENPRCAIILDSASALASRKELDDEITANTRVLGPKILASFCRKMGMVVPAKKCIIILMVHQIANTSGYGAPWVEDAGTKIQYQMDVKLKCKNRTPNYWEEKGKKIGQIIDWEVVSSALGPPGQRIQNYLRYGEGIDKKWEIIAIACDLGLIDKPERSGWYTLTFLGEDGPKINGQHKVKEYFVENPNHYDDLEKQLHQMLT